MDWAASPCLDDGLTQVGGKAGGGVDLKVAGVEGADARGDDVGAAFAAVAFASVEFAVHADQVHVQPAIRAAAIVGTVGAGAWPLCAPRSGSPTATDASAARAADYADERGSVPPCLALERWAAFGQVSELGSLNGNLLSCP